MARAPRRLVPAVVAAPVVVAVLLLVAACGDDARSPDGGVGAGTEPADPPVTPPPGPPTTPTDGSPGEPTEQELGPFDFVAEGVLGGQVVGAELAGSDTVVWFWAPW